MHKRLDSILTKIQNIEIIIEKSGSITNALADEAVYKPAILMHLVSIAEQFQKMQNDMDFDTLSKFEKDDVRGAIALRNFIAYDYDGVNLSVVEDVLRVYLPNLKKTIISLNC